MRHEMDIFKFQQFRYTLIFILTICLLKVSASKIYDKTACLFRVVWNLAQCQQIQDCTRNSSTSVDKVSRILDRVMVLPNAGSLIDIDLPRLGTTNEHGLTAFSGSALERTSIEFPTTMEAISHAIFIPDTLSYPPSSFCIPSFYAKDVDSVLIPEGLIRDRIKGLAREIFDAYASSDAEPLVLVCVLKSAFKFFSALQLEIEYLNVELCGTSDYRQAPHSNGELTENGSFPDRRSRRSLPLLCEFIRVKSYVNMEMGSDVQVQGVLCPEEAFNKKNVLIVEDIIDSGRTMQALIRNLKQYNPKSLRVASMLWKRVSHGGKNPYPPDFFGFEIPDKFVIGFGMDYNEKFRDLNHLCIINEAGIQRYATNPS